MVIKTRRRGVRGERIRELGARARPNNYLRQSLILNPSIDSPFYLSAHSAPPRFKILTLNNRSKNPLEIERVAARVSWPRYLSNGD